MKSNCVFHGAISHGDCRLCQATYKVAATGIGLFRRLLLKVDVLVLLVSCLQGKAFRNHICIRQLSRKCLFSASVVREFFNRSLVFCLNCHVNVQTSKCSMTFC